MAKKKANEKTPAKKGSGKTPPKASPKKTASKKPAKTDDDNDGEGQTAKDEEE